MPTVYNQLDDIFKPLEKNQASLLINRDAENHRITYELNLNGKKRDYVGIDRKDKYEKAKNFFKFAERHLHELAQQFYRKPSWKSIRLRLKGLGARITDIADLQQILDELSENLVEGSVLKIYTDECWIPWEIVFDTRSKIFLSEKYIVARDRITQNRLARRFDSDSPSYSPNLKRILNIIGNKTGCSSEALNLFTDERYQNKVDACDPIHRQYYNVADVLQLMDDGADLIHFTCHGMTNEIGERYLQIGPRNVDHHLYSMMLETIDLGGKIIFLNACSSIAPEHSIFSDVEDLSSFGWLIKKKGGAIIGTLAPISGKVSTRVANSFYSHFLLENKSIGESLFETRQELAAEEEPHALMYSLFGDPHLIKNIQ
jgi:hypothetical protein